MGKKSTPIHFMKKLKKATNRKESKTVKRLEKKWLKVSVQNRACQMLNKEVITFQRPQAEPGMKEDVEDDNKMICVAAQDDFVLKQDICVMCGSLGNDLEGRLIVCTQCGQCYHPHCVNVRVNSI
jgi:hypothetical protein